MNEYIANLDDVKAAYVIAGLPATDPEEVGRRQRAFDRLIRSMQDEFYDEGYNIACLECGL